MRDIMDLNFGWRFSPDFKPEYARPDFKDTAFKLVDIPHIVEETPRSCSGGKLYSAVTCYRKMFVLPSSFKGRRLFLHFDGVMGCAAAFFNGKPICAHKGGFTPFYCEVTSLVKNGDNLITVVVDSTEREDTPPFGGQLDMPCGGGIYREVRLEATDDVSIDTFTAAAYYSDGDWNIDIKGKLTSDKGAGFTFYLFDSDNKKISAKYYNCSNADFSCTWELPCEVDLWSCDNPKLYTLKIALDSGDEVSTRIGFRTVKFEPDGFYLNDSKLRLIGLSRHQNYPVIGNALPKSAQYLDAELIKELGCNAVFTAHCPPSHHFLDRCDELGILVIEDIPAYGHIGNDDWKDALCENLNEMIIRDISHPSVILWNIKADNAPEDADLEKRLADIAHRLDPTRQLGGIHDTHGTVTNEDVFLYKDYSHNGENPGLERRKNVIKTKTPYIVISHTGRSYPAKSFDRESVLLQQALRHARALDAAYGDPDMCGVFGGYLSDFISGGNSGASNSICSYAICDRSRIKKLAAYVYMAQQEKQPILKISSRLAPDEPCEVWAVTNCDEVRLNIDGNVIGSYYPNRKLFPHLPHPPIQIDDPDGRLFSSGKVTFEGIIGANTAASVVIEPLKRAQLRVTPSSTQLHHCDTYDTARVELEAVDQNGLRLPYCFDAVNIDCDGSMEVIGSRLFSLEGGAAAFYVRTKGGKGKASVKIATESLGEYQLAFDISRTLPPKDMFDKKESADTKDVKAETASPKAPASTREEPPPVVVHDFEDDDAPLAPSSNEVRDAVHTFNEKRIKKNRKHK